MKSKIIIICLVCVSLIAAFLISEYITSKFFADEINRIIDPEPYRNIVNIQGFRVSNPNVIYDERINGYYRIICLGDSFSYGHGVNNNKTYPFLLL